MKPRRRHRSASESLFVVDFPNSDNKFAVLLDRTDKNVIIDTVEDGRRREQHFTVDTLESNSLIRSLILAFEQRQPGAKISLYVDCVSYGMIATPKTMRDMYTKMDLPTLQMMRERKYHMEIDQNSIKRILSANNCSIDVANMHTKRNLDLLFNANPALSNELADQPRSMHVDGVGPFIPSDRSDIPVGLLTDLDDCTVITSTINKLIIAVNNLAAKIDRQTDLIVNMDKYLRECNYCSVGMAKCSSHPVDCYPGVECVDTLSGPKCGSCPRGYKGDGLNCEKIHVTCAEKYCASGVQCHELPHGAVCGVCPRGYTGNGEYCEQLDVITCAEKRCAPNVECREDASGARCGPCPPGYTGNGEYCVKDVITCADIRCFPGVRCEERPDGARCGPCPRGYTGDGQYCDRVTTCAEKRCPPNYHCEERSDGAVCSPCPSGTGGNGERCDPIYTCETHPCFNGVRCDNSESGPICGECPYGYYGDGRHCSRGPKCSDNPCYPGVPCRDTDHGAECGECPPGYEGDGVSCRPKQETCRTHNPCDPRVRCHDTSHGPVCGECPAGTTGDGYRCQDVYPSCSQQPCFRGVSCEDTPSGPKCGPCPPGLTGDGIRCRRICDYRPCGNGELHCCPYNQKKKQYTFHPMQNFNKLTIMKINRSLNLNFLDVQCYDSSNPPYYSCSCPPGYEFNQSTCVDIDECARYRPCDRLSQCYNRQPGYECGPCPPGYTGNSGGFFRQFSLQRSRQYRCVDVDECAEGSANCPSGRECKNTEGSYDCEVVTAPCPCLDKCDPNARCHTLSFDVFRCICNTGWAGDGIVCGKDTDIDGWPDQNLPCDGKTCRQDNCRLVPNSGQEDSDNDGIGDSCDNDSDNDGHPDDQDNCRLRYNPDQANTDGDRFGDECDNCPDRQNNDQRDFDHDGIGDECDDDIDGDGLRNSEDNCPKKPNRDQKDRDRDGFGDVCDNCPFAHNPEQRDYNENLVGDACEYGDDTDKDGIRDHVDNCKRTPNSDQQDVDGDGIGDACDNDIDNDGVLNNFDNCIFIPNPDQKNRDNNTRGDACDDDLDGDGIKDSLDNCPNNTQVYKTDFSSFQTVMLDPVGDSQLDPIWVINHEGAEITQTVNNDPGLAIGYDQIGGVDYEGTFFVNTDNDNDYVGFVFSYQSNRKFYVGMWKKESQSYWLSTPFNALAMPSVQIKLVNSQTGPGEMLRNSLWHTGTIKNQVTLLWEDPRNDGWKSFTSYRWKLIHRPKIGLIRLKMFEGDRVVTDSGNIFDRTLRGGRLGVFSFSQENVIWSNLQYKCNDFVPKDIYNELSPELQRAVLREP
ncbi:thrombospondin [Holotrichia oblita]|uniref:Thrombospondin n=1 Tax=Holotrichia oblita TaxID=644536 RepID=A0ACB9TKN5_HOLOL|nr:thrombospondin [Holotrichia oblita]